MKKLGKPAVQNMPIPLPSLERQKAIVSGIDDLAIETRRLESRYRQKFAAQDALKNIVVPGFQTRQ
jgi:restriction endonuclease S subunit